MDVSKVDGDANERPPWTAVSNAVALLVITPTPSDSYIYGRFNLSTGNNKVYPPNAADMTYTMNIEELGTLQKHTGASVMTHPARTLVRHKMYMPGFKNIYFIDNPDIEIPLEFKEGDSWPPPSATGGGKKKTLKVRGRPKI
jgi:hypothetical protein